MKIAKALPTTLAAPFAATDMTFTLSALVDSKNNPLVLSSIGSFVVIVFKQGDVIEMTKVSGITQNGDGSATCTVATNGRDIDPTSPYAGYSSGEDFQAGAEAIITNDPLSMSTFANLAEANIFSVVPQTTSDPVAANDLTRKSYVDNLVLGVLTTIDLIVPAVAGATVAAGIVVYLDTASGTWKLASASTPATVLETQLAIAQGSGTSGNAIAGGVLLQGVDIHQSGLTSGVPLYVSNTPGGISATPGTTSVAVGVANGATAIYFSPRFDQQISQDQLNAMANAIGGVPTGTNPLLTQGALSAIEMPSGAFVAFAGTSVPTGWLLCNGQAVSRTTYAALFSAVGVAFGSGDGSTTFNVPDMRGNVAAGYKSADANFGTLGAAVGEAAHVLTTPEMPSHSHSIAEGTSNFSGFVAVAGTSTGSQNTGSTGGGGAHNNIQPSLTANFIIKT